MTKDGKLRRETVIEFFNALIEGYKEEIQAQSSEPTAYLRKPSIKLIAHNSLSQKNLHDGEGEAQTRRKNTDRRRSTIRNSLDSININLPFENSEVTSLSWNEYQEIKLIFYSVNFRGKECIHFSELQTRKRGSARIPQAGEQQLQSEGLVWSLLCLHR